MQTALSRQVGAVEQGRVRDGLDRDGPDLITGEEREGSGGDPRADGDRGIHLGSVASRHRQKAWGAAGSAKVAHKKLVSRRATAVMRHPKSAPAHQMRSAGLRLEQLRVLLEAVQDGLSTMCCCRHPSFETLLACFKIWRGVGLLSAEKLTASPLPHSLDLARDGRCPGPCPATLMAVQGPTASTDYQTAPSPEASTASKACQAGSPSGSASPPRAQAPLPGSPPPRSRARTECESAPQPLLPAAGAQQPAQDCSTGTLSDAH